ncbi:MAG: dTDP-4-dehydrorhamnose reductase [Pseudomonadota bacterium]
MKKILLLGKDGQLGWSLQRALAPLGALVALGRSELDLSNSKQLRARVLHEQAQLIVNAAAYTAVDQAETECAQEGAQSACWQVNASAPGVLAEAAQHCGALLLHYSSDYVFDGGKNSAYVESDTPNPQSFYGRSKLAGEQAISASGCSAIIFRTSWVFGAHGHNFVKTILRMAHQGRALRIIDDQIGAPTPSDLIADISSHVVRQRWRNAAQAGQEDPNLSGTQLYHLAAAKPLSWCAFARAIVTQARAVSGAKMPNGKAWPDAQSISAISTSEYPLPAPRPANSRLDCTRLEQDFSLTLPDWQPYLTRLLPQLIAQG